MTWNTQDTYLSWYVPKANVDHTISGQGTADNTLDHSATTPSVMTYTTVWILKNNAEMIKAYTINYFTCQIQW